MRERRKTDGRKDVSWIRRTKEEGRTNELGKDINKTINPNFGPINNIPKMKSHKARSE
jgi:hypothetical protein